MQAGLTIGVSVIGAVAYQPTGFDEISLEVYRRDRMTHGQGYELRPSRIIERVGADEQCVGSPL